MSAEACPECSGRCCRDDLGYPLAHLNWDVGEHWCEYCEDGTVPPEEGVEMAEKTTTNAVVHPKHYNSGSIEVITAIEDWQLNFSCGNVVKYVVRAPHKGKHLEDLRKAREYLDFEIARVERLEQVALLPAKGNK